MTTWKYSRVFLFGFFFFLQRYIFSDSFIIANVFTLALHLAHKIKSYYFIFFSQGSFGSFVPVRPVT